VTRQLVVVLAIAGLAAGALMAWLALQQPTEPEQPPPTQARQAPATVAPEAVGHVDVTVFFTAPDGNYLVGVPREVPLVGDAAAQGREVLLAQLEPAPPPLVSPIPQGTTLRGFFVTDRGDAYVDLSVEAAVVHAGGSAAELLTVYAIVHAVTASLPEVHRVQILVGGSEVESLVGHVDLRQPLTPDRSLVRRPRAPAGSAGATPSP
jgi:spore germination protein GerM